LELRLEARCPYLWGGGVTFDPITVCSDSIDWAAAVIIAAVLAPPTILLALRNVNPENGAKTLLNVGLWAAVAASLAILLVQFKLLPELLAIIILLTGFGASAAILGVQVYRWCLRRE
jgi:hypothetical protein